MLSASHNLWNKAPQMALSGGKKKKKKERKMKGKSAWQFRTHSELISIPQFRRSPGGKQPVMLFSGKSPRDRELAAFMRSTKNHLTQLDHA